MNHTFSRPLIWVDNRRGFVYTLLSPQQRQCTLQRYYVELVSLPKSNQMVSAGFAQVIPLSDLNLTKLEIHGVCMSLCFGLFLPIAAIIARYGKGVGSARTWWLKFHTLFIFLGLCFLLIGLGFVFSVVGLTGDAFAGHPNSNVPTHSLVGFGLLLAMLAQIALGMAVHRSYNEEAKQESTIDNVHSILGRTILIIGAVNIGLGLQHLKSVFLLQKSNTFMSIFLGVWITLQLFLVIAVGVLEFTVGRGTRYYSGNIFAVAKQLGGAKALFDMPSFERNAAIKRASIDLGLVSEDDDVAAMTKTNLATIEDSATQVLASAPREKEGNLSPFLYRPTWDAGLRKAPQIYQIAAVEQHMIREDSQTAKAIPSDLLSRLREAEIPAPQVRSRSNSVAKGSTLLENSIVAAERLQTEISIGSKSGQVPARPRAKSFSSRPSSIYSRQASLARDTSFRIGRENSVTLPVDASATDILKDSPPFVATNNASSFSAPPVAASESLSGGALERLTNKLQKSSLSGKKPSIDDA